MKYRALACTLPILACGLVIFACGDDASTSTLPSPEAGTVDARAGAPTTKPKGDDDDVVSGDDDDDGKDAGKPDAAKPKDAGADADADAETPPPPPRKRVFITKSKFTGDLKTAGGGANGADGADRICQMAADAANLGGGGWTAWVSVTGKNAIDRLPNDGPWYLVDRTTLVFSRKSSIQNGPAVAIDKNETGTSLVAGGGGPLQNRVWSGSLNTGVEVAGKSCADWTNGTDGSAVAGAFRETASWSRYALQANEGCDKTWPIYCFEQ